MSAFPEVSDIFPRRSGEDPCESLVIGEPTERLSVIVVDDVPTLEALRPVWKTLSHNLDTDLDYYLHNLKVDPTILGPYVITVYQGDVPQAMLIGQIRRRSVSSVVSFVSIHGPRARVLEVIAGGRMGPRSAAIDRLFASQLGKALRNADIDSICFQRLPLESDLFRELQQLPGLLMKGRVPHLFRYSVVPLTAPPGKRVPAFSGKNRREVRRKTRILQRAFPGKAHFRCFSSDELEIGVRDAASVDATTWQHFMGYSLLNTPHARQNLAFCAQQGWLRIYVMYVDDLPVAFLIGHHYQQTFYCEYTGYHPDFARYSVGSLLTTWALENLAAAGVERVDLGEGGQEHNRRLGCHVYEEGTVHLYSPTLRGLCVGVFFAATWLVRAGGRSIREGLRLHYASRAWSQFLLTRRKTRQVTSAVAADLQRAPQTAQALKKS